MKKITILLGVMLLALAGCAKSSNIMSDYPGFKKKDHHFIQPASNEEFVQNLLDKKEGLYYVGFPQCPWCVALVPIMEEVLTETDRNIFYMNIKDESLSDDLRKKYVAWDAALPDSLVSGTNPQEGIRGGYSPFVIAIDKDGNIKTHAGTVDGHNPTQRDMTEDEITYLKARLKRMFEPITNMKPQENNKEQ